MAASVLEEIPVNFYKMLKLPRHCLMHWCVTHTQGVCIVVVFKYKPDLMKIMRFFKEDSAAKELSRINSPGFLFTIILRISLFSVRKNPFF